MDHETHVFGLAVPLGTVSRTGVGGLTLGGGVGWLMRKYGMTIDNVISFQVVTADGKVLTASATENDDLFWALPFPAMQSMLDPSFPDGRHNYWKSSMHEALSDDAVDVIVDRADQMPSRQSVVVAEYYGGAAGRVPASATAFPHRHVCWDIIFLAEWSEPTETDANRKWARDAADALVPYATGDHVLGALDEDEAAGSAFGANLGRLTEIKKKYDPKNFFRVNQNVRPDAVAAMGQV